MPMPMRRKARNLEFVVAVARVVRFKVSPLFENRPSVAQKVAPQVVALMSLEAPQQRSASRQMPGRPAVLVNIKTEGRRTFFRY